MGVFIFDPFLSQTDLVIGKDLTEDCEHLFTDSTIEHALEVFSATNLNVLPVIVEKTGKLAGIIRHKDILTAIKSK